MTALKLIEKISERMHTLDTIATIQFLIDLNSVGVSMMKRFKSRARSSGAIDLGDLVYTHAERQRITKSSDSLSIKMHKNIRDEGVMIAGVMMGAKRPATEAGIGLGDYRQWVAASYASPFKYQPSAAVWDYISNPGLTAKLQSTINKGLENKDGNIAIIKRLEKRLGIDAAYPRWLQSRILSITPPRENKTTGLLRRPTHLADVERSFAYNAYRLFNTEVGQSLVGVQTRFAEDNPYITSKRVILSPYHPKCDECDKVSKRTWKPSDTPLLVHPNCLCYYRPHVTQATIDRLRSNLDKETDSKKSKRLDALRSMYPFAIAGVASYLMGQYSI